MRRPSFTESATKPFGDEQATTARHNGSGTVPRKEAANA